MSIINDRIVKRWFAGTYCELSGSRMWTNGATLYSYRTAIAYRSTETNKVYLNRTHYTSQTSRHQSTAWAYLREHAAPKEIVIVTALAYGVNGPDLMRYATVVNPQKRVDFQAVIRSAKAKTKSLGHELQPFDIDSNSFNYGSYSRCPLCGHAVYIQRRSLEGDWSFANRHYKFTGNASRYRCSRRLQPVVEQAPLQEILAGGYE